ncbi:tetratricopeptide repeat protein [Dysgonomonas sp. 521]|uniref:tetratricopeptide repeat protein n=1 Tax=Dysgonomonas sp. 521 TaxID=2302932 RepID=UPI0013D29F9B|nr:tetratricopeptide repeat protein [Dysgonomonas sp. 521]NDV96551.1 tetratricopeptide repeat protein [Dysgonomonas sp. 521]
MKKIIFITLFTFIAVSLSAQKEVRKAIRTGNSAYNEQRYGAAEAEYNKALDGNAGSKEASFNLANTYYRQQKWDDAIKEYQHYLTLENENPDKMSAAWSNMGNTFLKKKANEKGQAQQAPLQPGQQPEQPKQQEDNLKLSMEAYKNALRLNPKDDETRYNLAVVQKMIQDRQNEDGGGGQDKNQDQDKDQKQDQKDQQNQNNDQKKDQKDQQNQQNQNQMSQENMQQMLQAIEQDEKNTQQRVNQAKAQERKQKNENNRKQNKDW